MPNGNARAALALWRGPPLADVADEPFAAAAIRHCDELKLRAAALAIDADLAAGRHEGARRVRLRRHRSRALRQHARSTAGQAERSGYGARAARRRSAPSRAELRAHGDPDRTALARRRAAADAGGAPARGLSRRVCRRRRLAVARSGARVALAGTRSAIDPLGRCAARRRPRSRGGLRWVATARRTVRDRRHAGRRSSAHPALRWAVALGVAGRRHRAGDPSTGRRSRRRQARVASARSVWVAPREDVVALDLSGGRTDRRAGPALAGPARLGRAEDSALVRIDPVSTRDVGRPRSSGGWVQPGRTSRVDRRGSPDSSGPGRVARRESGRRAGGSCG